MVMAGLGTLHEVQYEWSGADLEGALLALDYADDQTILLQPKSKP